MSPKAVRLVLFTVLAAIQLAVAAQAIIRSELAIRGGEIFRFRLQPVDPVDAFRGRYVSLRFAVDRAPVAEGQSFMHGRRVFVRLGTDDEGFAVLGEASASAPEGGSYLRLRTGVEFEDEEGRRMVSISLPFRRYYMTEALAREVDRSLWRRGQRPAWVTVRVRNGTGVIEDLFVDGRPVREWIAEGGPEIPPATPTPAPSSTPTPNPPPEP